MSLASPLFGLVATLLICVLPRHLAALPLLVTAAYVSRNATLDIGGVHLTVLHLLVAFGMLRTVLRGEKLANGRNAVDLAMLWWGVVMLATSILHDSSQWVFRVGLVWRDLGSYLLLRVFVADSDDVLRLFRALSVLLLPLAALMLIEKSLAYNFFSALGGDSAVVLRDGQVRARGPFAHPILAGTVGATCLPMAFCLWRRHRFVAIVGLFSGAAIVYASASSGPALMTAITLGCMLLWPARRRLRALLWLGAAALVALAAAMKDPVYYLMARIDVAGGSQGWHRARLIQSSIEHLGEWWLAGTDYTRHWMPTGIHANAEHTDITNHLLGMGVYGGLALMLLFVLALVAAFRILARELREEGEPARRFLVWTLGAMLFGQVMNFFSIALFDHSVVYFLLVLAAAGALRRQPANRKAATRRRWRPAPVHARASAAG